MAASTIDNAGSIEASGFDTIAGTPDEVGKQLAGIGAERVVALTIRRGDARTAQRLATALAKIAPLVLATLQRRERETLAKIIDALAPDVPPPQHLLVEARWPAKRSVAQSGEG